MSNTVKLEKRADTLEKSKTLGRVLNFSKPDSFAPLISVKWIEAEVYPEIGRYYFIKSECQNKSFFWLGRVKGAQKTSLLGDTSSEMILAFPEVDLMNLKSEIFETIVNIELLVLCVEEKGIIQLKRSLNIVPTYGDYVCEELRLSDSLIDPSVVLSGYLKGVEELALSNGIEEKSSVISLADVMPSIKQVRKRTNVFGKTGMGKTTLGIDLIKNYFLKECSGDDSRPVIIFDVQGEFSTDELNPKSFFYQGDSFGLNIAHHRIDVYTDRNLKIKKNNIKGSPRLDLSKLGIIKSLEFLNLKNEEKTSNWYRDCFNQGVSDAFKSVFEVKPASKESLEAKIESLKAVFPSTSSGSSSGSAFVQRARALVRFHGDLKLEDLFTSLAENKLIIFDIANFAPDEQEGFVRLIINEILENNREKLVENKVKDMLKPLIVIDEAQLFFTNEQDDRSPLVRLFKEGRKFELSSMLLTQQPSSLPTKLTSQAENIFTFHLSANNDVRELKNISSFFTDSILYQVTSNLEKYRPFFVTEGCPFAMQIDCLKPEMTIKTG